MYSTLSEFDRTPPCARCGGQTALVPHKDGGARCLRCSDRAAVKPHLVDGFFVPPRFRTTWDRADYLWFLKNQPAVVRLRAPHPGEVEALTGSPPDPSRPYKISVVCYAPTRSPHVKAYALDPGRSWFERSVIDLTIRDEGGCPLDYFDVLAEEGWYDFSKLSAPSEPTLRLVTCDWVFTAEWLADGRAK